MFSRRDFLQLAAATAALTGASGGLARAAARQQLTQDELLAFQPKGQVTLLHVTDLHAQLVPIYFREPSINLGVGGVKGLPPHVTGRDLLQMFDIEASTPEAYALSTDTMLDHFMDPTRIAKDLARWSKTSR